MKICVIDENKQEKLVEMELSTDSDNASIRGLEKCFKIDIDGNKIPIYIPRMSNEKATILCKYVFAKYQTKT